MTIITQVIARSGWYMGESEPHNLVNEEAIVDSGAGILLPGTVLGKVTATGHYVLHDTALTNGAQAAAAILFHRVDATSAAVKTVASVRGPATINGNKLFFKAGISDADKAAAIAALRAKGLVVLPQHAV